MDDEEMKFDETVTSSKAACFLSWSVSFRFLAAPVDPVPVVEVSSGCSGGKPKKEVKPELKIRVYLTLGPPEDLSDTHISTFH